MSLPYPSTTKNGGGSVFSSSERDAWDAPLIALAQKSNGDLRTLFHAFFSFLHRRTDFYLVSDTNNQMGFREGHAEQLLLAAFRQFPLKKMPSSSTSQKPPRVVSSDVVDEKKKTTTVTNKNTNLSDDAGEKVRYTKEGKQIPVGNGGSTDKYQWTQTIDEVSVVIPVPEGTRGKDTEVLVKPTSLSIRLHQQQVFLEGELPHAIKAEESTWTLEGGVLLVTLDKMKKTWWECVLTQETEKIDTTLVDSTRNIREYDESTQGMIRKIVHDQRQGRLDTNRLLGKSDDVDGNVVIPNLPPGVEYIDQSTLENAKIARSTRSRNP